eukprot:CAMPEP_0119308406 /NCGR_PEP_ID=MMETSP1333-20130426/10569_1 /TAXON_ID=418940 /ORGANISM="Scyphosphaera apsteinii, Strain RCC1455" /LENGTH=200 /DNA_ID=CAMNT_0007312161 /DNA_START=21 /DNA_END=623 /DNA_ORIENTATION=+
MALPSNEAQAHAGTCTAMAPSDSVDPALLALQGLSHDQLCQMCLLQQQQVSTLQQQVQLLQQQQVQQAAEIQQARTMAIMGGVAPLGGAADLSMMGYGVQPGLAAAAHMAPPTTQNRGPPKQGSNFFAKPADENPFHKTSMCKRFNSPGGCSFGDRCNFAHGAEDLRQKPATWVSEAGGTNGTKRMRPEEGGYAPLVGLS